MGALDAWQTEGFDGIAREYQARLSRERQTLHVIADDCDLLVRRIGTNRTDRRNLREALASPSWLDAKLGGLRV
jgi:hypothetical protein